MTDIQQWQPNEVAVTPASTPAGFLHEWARATADAFSIAKVVCGTSMTPQQYRNKPEEAAAAIMAGAEIGFDPFKAMAAIDVIQGTAAMRAIALRAVVQGHGHEIIMVESTSARCRMKGRRKGSSEWQTVTWTIDRAKEMGLLSRDQWKKQPTGMLVARATSELARLVAADAIMGIPYSAEEITDNGGAVPTDDAEVDAPAQSGTRRMSRKRAEPAPEPGTAPEPDPAADAETGEVAGITPQQSKALHASFNDAGVKDREQRLAYCRNLIGRDLASSSDLTKVEASAVIDALRQEVQNRNQPTDALPPMFDPDAE